jgi:pimeloyl-ACP methyl ester carboxylesterase
VPAGPFSPAHHLAASRDGTPIAFFEVRPPVDAVLSHPAPGEPGRAPLLLVHGAAADHTTWRTSGPRLALRRRVFAMDRRGRGASGDGPVGSDGAAARPAYSIQREYEDVAAVAEAVAALTSAPATDVAGHSYGGRVGLGASLETEAVRRVVVYEGAPVPAGMSYRPPGLVEDVRAALASGDNERALATFLQGIVGLSDAGLEAYRAESVWPARVAAAPTILREIEAEAGPPASVDALGRATEPVLLLLGSESRSPFRIGTDALAERLADARVEVIEGAAHAAHHTHVDDFVARVEAFLDR